MVCVGVAAETPLYNLLLHVYNSNGYMFKTSEFLEEMMLRKCLPDAVSSNHSGSLTSKY